MHVHSVSAWQRNDKNATHGGRVDFGDGLVAEGRALPQGHRLRVTTHSGKRYSRVFVWPGARGKEEELCSVVVRSRKSLVEREDVEELSKEAADREIV